MGVITPDALDFQRCIWRVGLLAHPCPRLVYQKQNARRSPAGVRVIPFWQTPSLRDRPRHQTPVMVKVTVAVSVPPWASETV
jgi:hypothetical protein